MIRTWLFGHFAAVAVALLVGATFAVDLMLPLGIAGGIPYVAPVLAAAWLPRRRHVGLTAAACSVLAIAGFYLSPEGAPLWAAIPNRLLALGAIWTIALMTVRRRRVEDELADREKETRAVVNSTADGILTLDEHARILSANPAAQHLFGTADGELLRKSFAVVLGESEHGRIDGGLPAVLADAAQHAGMPFESVGRRSNGTSFPMEVIVTTRSAPAGTRHTVVVRDVTERRMLERNLFVVAERQRQTVAQLLQEQIGQSLTGLNLISSQLARRLAKQESPEASEAAELAALLREADELVLRASEVLAPVQTDDGLPAALRRLAETISERFGVSVHVVSRAEPTWDRHEASELYRMVQIVLEWALEQGRPRTVTVALDEATDGSAITLRIRSEDTLHAIDWNAIARRLQFRARQLGRPIRLSGDDYGVTWIVQRSHPGVDGGETRAASAGMEAS